MKIIFAGTPELAVPTLTALKASKHNLSMVLTQPDRPSGRGQKLKTSAVKTFAQIHNIPICQPKTLKTPLAIETIKSQKPDLMIVLAYGLLVPKTILAIPKLGCVNVHISLLPRWRGAAPAQRAILAGDKITGISLMQMDAGLDTGDVLARASLKITPDETTESLHQRLGILGAETLMHYLNDIAKNTLAAEKQDEELATYAKKIDKQEACIDWQLGAKQIDRIVRAFNPWPIAFTFLDGERLRIWETEIIENSTSVKPGAIIKADKQGLDIACGTNVLRIKKLQRPGGKIQPIQNILNANGNFLTPGIILGNDE